MAKPRILITGDTGLLGANLALLWRDAYDIIGVSRGATHVAGTRHIALDLCDISQADTLISDVRPDAVVHTAALADIDACERDPLKAHTINTVVTDGIARAAARIGTHLIHISTDAFYQSVDGAPCTEEHPPTLGSVYCRTKFAAEEAVTAYARGLVLRTNFYGCNLKDKSSFSEWILGGLTGGAELNMFSDVIFSPILVNDLADILRAAITKPLFGLYNAGGTGCISKYAFAVHLRDALGIRTGKLSPSSIAIARLDAWRSSNMSSDNTRLSRVLPGNIPAIAEGIDRLKDLIDAGYHSKLKEAAV